MMSILEWRCVSIDGAAALCDLAHLITTARALAQASTGHVVTLPAGHFKTKEVERQRLVTIPLFAMLLVAVGEVRLRLCMLQHV